MLTRWYQTPTHSMVDWARPLFGPTLFDGVFDDFFAQVRSASAGPRFTSHDEGNAVVLRAEVPGLSEKDIHISFENGTLTISGERKIEAPEGYQARIRERTNMRFARSFSLSSQMEVEKAEAKIEHGVLTLTIPRRPEAQPRQIQIKTA